MNLFNKKSNFDKYYKEFIPLIKKEQSQKYLFIILSIVASIFFLIFAIRPTVSTIANLLKQKSDAEAVEAKLSQKVLDLSNLIQQYQVIEDDLPLVYDAVPQRADAPTLVGQVRAIGIISEVEVENVEVLPVTISSEKASKSAAFLFDISGNSTFENAQKFLDNLTTMQRAVTVESIQITSSKQIDEAYDFVFKGKAYFKK